MKNKIFLLLAGLLITAGTFAQTFVNRNGDEKFGFNKTTTDSIPKYIDSVIIKANEGGMIEVAVIGYAKDSAVCLTGKKLLRFNKRRGTLTIGTAVDEMTTVTDALLSTCTWALTAANGKIYIQVTGKTGYNISWNSIIKRRSISYP